MEKIVVNAALAAKLAAATGPVELVDADGKPLGVWTPAAPGETTPIKMVPGDPFTEAEIREGLASIARGDRGITTAELLEKLRNL